MSQPEHISILRRAGPLLFARLGVASLTFAIPMVLARMLLPSSYGTFKQAWLLSNTLTLVLPLGLTQSLVYFVPREPLHKRAWVTHTLLLTTALGAVAALLLLTAGKLVADLFHNPELHALMPYVAAFTAFKMTGACLDTASMAEGRIKESAIIRVVSEGFYTACLVAGALAFGTVAGALLGAVVATCMRASAAWLLLGRQGLEFSAPGLRRQLAYSLPFGAAFALIIPQQQFHSYLVSASVTAAAFAVYSVGCFQLPIVDMLYTPVSEILQLGIAEFDARNDAASALKLFHEAVARLSFVFLPTVALLFITAPQLIQFLFTARYLAAVPVFRLALVSIPMAALPLDGVMRARAQNGFMLRISVLKLALTVPLAVAGLRLFGPIGALGGWICAEETCRMIVLARTSRLFGAGLLRTLPRELWFQAAAAAVAAVPGALSLYLLRGPLLVQLFLCGLTYAAAYLAALRAMGQLPPVRDWIPRRAAMQVAT